MVVPASHGGTAYRGHFCDRCNHHWLPHGCSTWYCPSCESIQTPNPLDSDAIQGLAITLITGLGLQVLLGSLAHWYKPKSRGPAAPSGRGVLHFVHIGLGLAVVVIGWATALTGTHSRTASSRKVKLSERISSAMGWWLWSRLR